MVKLDARPSSCPALDGELPPAASDVDADGDAGMPDGDAALREVLASAREL